MNPFPNSQLDGMRGENAFFMRTMYHQELIEMGPDDDDDENLLLRIAVRIEKKPWTDFQPVEDLGKWLLDTFRIEEVSTKWEPAQVCRESGSIKKIMVEVTRQSSLIAKDIRRGRANVLIMSAADRILLPEEGSLDMVMFNTRIVEDLLPPKHILVLYEGAHLMDVGFLYHPDHGVLTNRDHAAYGRILKIID